MASRSWAPCYLVSRQAIRYALHKGGKVLMALPTGQLASRMRQEFRDEIDIDTCHGAFLLHRPEQEALPCLQTGHVLVVVDEFPQLSKIHFERIMRAWDAAARVPTLLFAGDFQQLPSISGESAKDSVLYKMLKKIHLTKSFRCDDDELLTKINAIRTHVPKQEMLYRILRGHKAWSDHHEPTSEDLQSLLADHPNTTIVTCTRAAAARVNDRIVEMYATAIFAEIPGDFDVNPENFDEAGKLRQDRKPIPSRVRLFKTAKLHLTRNLNKQNDFVNGMEAEVLDFDDSSKCLTVVTKTGRTLAVHLYTDPEPAHKKACFFPVRHGYASTLYKMQGAQLPHITIWLDVPYQRAAAYVAISRVK